MTVIVGITDGIHSYIGGDRGASDGDAIISMHRPKITKIGDWIFGYAGTLGTGQLLEFINLPRVDRQDPYKLLRIDIVEQLKSAYDAFGRDIEDNGTDWIIGTRGRLFEMSSGDWGVFETLSTSIGTGSSFALGSLHTTQNWKDQERRIRLAVESAITYSPTCQGPIDILKI